MSFIKDKVRVPKQEFFMKTSYAYFTNCAIRVLDIAPTLDVPVLFLNEPMPKVHNEPSRCLDVDTSASFKSYFSIFVSELTCLSSNDIVFPGMSFLNGPCIFGCGFLRCSKPCLF